MSVSTGASSGIFPGHTAQTVTDMGWGGIKNGALLALAQSQFDVLVTGDKNLASQQNLANLSLAVIVLGTDDATSRLPRLGSRRARRINQTPAGKCGCCQMMNGKSSPEFDELWRERERLLASITIDPLWDSTASVSDDRERLAIDPVVAAPVAPES